MREIQSEPRGDGLRVGIAVSRFNQKVTGMLLQGCLDTLRECGVAEDDIVVVHAPGAFELPLICDRLAARGDFHAVIALGAVIRGETAHFDFISAECTRGLSQVARARGCPVAFGVLTTENSDQAVVRADPAQKNKGREAALAALEMANLPERIDERI